jgi:hypothetical protein
MVFRERLQWRGAGLLALQLEWWLALRKLALLWPRHWARE